MNSKSTKIAAVFYAVLLGAGLMACKEKGPIERVGEEVDEAIDTARNGKESTASKLDDAVDDLRDGVKDAAKEVKGK